MKTEGEAHRLRIYVNESDRWEGRPLYETIVREARDFGLAGATALRGIEGFGTHQRVHTVKVLRLSEDLPIVVEIIDQPDRIAAFMEKLDTIIPEGMTTLEEVRTVVYRRDEGEPTAADDELQLESEEDGAPVFSASEPPELADSARQILDAARSSAGSSRRAFADSVDVLLAMLCETTGIANTALSALGVDCETVDRCLQEVVSRDESAADYLAVLQAKSAGEARWLGDNAIGPAHLLLALCEIRPSAATDTLTRLGALPRDVCREVLKNLDHQDDWQRWLADHPDM